MLTRRSAGLVLAMAIISLGTRLSLAAEPGAERFVAEFAVKVLELVRTERGSAEQLERQLHPLALDAFDVPRIARFVLGRHWREMSDADRERFTRAFEDYIVHVYAIRFSGYHGERFIVSGSRPTGPSDVLVNSEITRPEGGAPIKLAWQLERSGERYRIVDVSVDGVSQAVTYREEFAAVIERHDGRISDLIAELQAKARA